MNVESFLAEIQQPQTRERAWQHAYAEAEQLGLAAIDSGELTVGKLRGERGCLGGIHQWYEIAGLEEWIAAEVDRLVGDRVDGVFRYARSDYIPAALREGAQRAAEVRRGQQRLETEAQEAARYFDSVFG